MSAGSRPLVVLGDPLIAEMCVAILDAAGLEPGYRFRGMERPVPSRRKIIGGGAKKPPLVIDTAPLEEDIDVLVLGLNATPHPARLIVRDARDARTLDVAHANVTTYALDSDATIDPPLWLGALAGGTNDGVQPFDLYGGGSFCGRFAIAHSDVRCALAAIAACLEGFGVHVETARAAIAAFSRTFSP